MRFAAISDIHGNSAALRAVLDDIAALGIYRVVNLGDHLSGPLDPRGTAEILMASGMTSIRGDQDRILAELDADGAASKKRWDYLQLERSHLDWLASLPSSRPFEGDVFLCHGTPRDDAGHWLERPTGEGVPRPVRVEQVEEDAGRIDASLFLCGHTHLPRICRLPNGSLVVNAGSVGCPGYRVMRPKPYLVEAGTPRTWPRAAFALWRSPHVRGRARRAIRLRTTRRTSSSRGFAPSPTRPKPRRRRRWPGSRLPAFGW